MGLSLEELRLMGSGEYQLQLARFGIVCECGGDFNMRCHEASEGLPCLVNAVRHPEAYRGFEKPTTGVSEAGEAEDDSTAHWVFDHGDAEVTIYDLHVDGDPECDHSFTLWAITSGAHENDPEEGAVEGWIRMESYCETCPARVGRLSTSVLMPNGTRR